MLPFLSTAFGLAVMLGWTAEAQDRETGKQAIAGTRVVVRTRNPYGTPLKVISVVAPGQRVKKGDLVVQLDPAQLEAEINKRKPVRYGAMASLEEHKAELRNAELQLEAHLAETKLRIEVAELELAEFKEGIFPIQKLSSNLEVIKAEQNLRSAEAAVASNRAKDTALKIPLAELELARLKQKVSAELTMPKEHKKRMAAVASAKRDLAVGRTLLETAVAKAKSQLMAGKARVDAEAGRLDHLMKQLQSCSLSAPHSGIVEQGPVPIAAGSLVHQGQVVLIIIPDKTTRNDE